MWYIQKKGRTEGPIPEETLINAIRKGEMGPYDLVFREGEARWQSLSDFSIFAENFKQQTPAPSSADSNSEQWVVLVRNKNKKDRRQKGPYTTAQMRDLIRSGDLKMSDYVWKEGMKEWYRLHSLDIFHQDNAPVDLPNTVITPIVNSTGAELLKNVTLQPRPQVKPPESPPPETTGTDLTKQEAFETAKTKDITKTLTAPVKKSSKHRSRKRPSAVRDGNLDITAVTQVRRISPLQVFLELSWPKRVFYSCLFVIGSLTALMSVLYFTSYRDAKLLSERKIERVAPPPTLSAAKGSARPEKSAKDNTAKETATNATPTPLPPEPDTPPKFMKARVAQGQSDDATIEVATNASRHYGTTLEIAGEAGRVIGVRSYFRQVKLRGVDGRKIAVESLNLRPGYYSIDVTLGEYSDHVSVAWKVNTKTFKTDFTEHRKKISYYAGEERYNLIKTSEFLEQQAKEMVAQVLDPARQAKPFGPYYSAWKKKLDHPPSGYLMSVNSKNRGNYVFSEAWLRLRELRDDLKVAAKALSSAENKAAPEATFDLRQIGTDLQRQKEAALQASLWR